MAIDGDGGHDRQQHEGGHGSGSAPAGEGRLVLLRHGRTEWAHAGRHTGLSDVPLDEVGEDQARAVAPVLGAVLHGSPALVLTSPLVRAARTAELAGLDAEVDADLVEWDYGAYEGMTSAQIAEVRGGAWELFADGVAPGGEGHPGESLEQVAARLGRVVERARAATGGGDVVLVAHGHACRVAATVWLGMDPRAGANLVLDPAAVCVLGSAHDLPTVERWNLSPALAGALA